MYILSFPIHYIKSRRAYKKQKQTALHMLAVSGVVRPGHVELRYAAPIASITAFRTQPTSINPSQTQSIPSERENCNITLNFKQTRQWTCNVSSTIIQLAKKPIVLPWTKQLDI